MWKASSCSGSVPYIAGSTAKDSELDDGKRISSDLDDLTILRHNRRLSNHTGFDFEVASRRDRIWHWKVKQDKGTSKSNTGAVTQGYRLARLTRLLGKSRGTFKTARLVSAAASGRPRSFSSEGLSFLIVHPEKRLLVTGQEQGGRIRTKCFEKAANPEMDG